MTEIVSPDRLQYAEIAYLGGDPDVQKKEKPPLWGVLLKYHGPLLSFSERRPTTAAYWQRHVQSRIEFTVR